MSNLLRCRVERVPGGSFWLHQSSPHSSSVKDNKLYFLSLGVLAKPVITKDLIEADDIDRKAVADFTDSLLAENLSSQAH